MGRPIAEDREFRDRRAVEILNAMRITARDLAAREKRPEPTWPAIATKLLDSLDEKFREAKARGHVPVTSHLSEKAPPQLAKQWTEALAGSKPLSAKHLAELEVAAIVASLYTPPPSSGQAAACGAAKKRRNRVALLARRIPMLASLVQQAQRELKYLLQDDHCVTPLNLVELYVWPGPESQLEIPEIPELPMVPERFADLVDSGIPIAWLSDVGDLADQLNDPESSWSVRWMFHPQIDPSSPPPRRPAPIPSPDQIKKAEAKRKKLAKEYFLANESALRARDAELDTVMIALGEIPRAP